MRASKVIISPSALQAILRIGAKGERRKLRNRLAALELAPHLGAPYDPIFDSARPAHDVLVTFVGRHGIYCTLDDESGVLNIEYVEECRCDPCSKFSS